MISKKDIKRLENKLIKFYENDKVKIISFVNEEFYHICININGWNYPYVILKECKSIDEVFNYIVKDLGKVGIIR